jgi:hypothetical protein
MKQHKYWPYDEVIIQTNQNENEVLIDCPWLKSEIEIDTKDYPLAKALSAKMQTSGLEANDINAATSFFSALSSYPLSYILPRATWNTNLDTFKSHFSNLDEKEIFEFLSEFLQEDINEGAKSLILNTWDWDTEGALNFSKTANGIDPVSLFTVARRFHLLSSVDTKSTEEIYNFVQSLDPSSELYQEACALMTRQNHYVTLLCGESLAPALENSGQAKHVVQEFIDDEFGHDRILAQALQSFGKSPEQIPVLLSSEILMKILKAAAKNNLLAFAMIVDFFERSSYQDSDPLAQVLRKGGYLKAAGQIDKHKDINDEGEHENVALEFLDYMGPCDNQYAAEALKIAELATYFMNSIASEAVSSLRKQL